ncbi:putative sporulation protein YtxC [Thermanaeromonas toyohensis ToBE]|uniref:Putative sporulation protein YtxC n=1 Tax=Thermanaeromonas toyohensis ToBE TaxID=698762 RepID=A0A1W1W097_9FIRM|nr:putative sporulation protein YtxC [Thermanaeromonas toyohensis]SMB99006.1 putative sporulation protein YtxC [Thermanaeromonas toyohensis ToBE]
MVILLASSRPLDFLLQKLRSLINTQLTFNQWQTGRFNFCRLFLPDQKKVREQVATSVAAFIIEIIEKELLEDILYSQYDLEDTEQAQNLCLRAKRILEQGAQGLSQGYWRGQPLTLRIKEYLEESSYLNIDGFVQFRLPDYLLELEQAIEEAIDEYIMEKEYDEFVGVLRYFLEIQEPRIEKVHVVLSPGGGFQLYDGKNKSLEKEYLDGFMVDIGDNDLNYEDLLLSALITLAPRQVVLHGTDKGKAWGTVNTIKNVFGDRVTVCNGCSRCRRILRKF